MRYDGILFDFDGVLVDSEPVHCACWAEVLAPAGITLEWETYRRHCIGVSDRAMLEFLAALAAQPVDVEGLWPRYADKKDLFRRRMAEGSGCSQETVDFMRSLKGYLLAVVTSSGRQEVEPLLERAGIHALIGAAVYGEDVSRHKPAPDPYLLAASRLGVRSPLVVEDSDAGVASAQAAGFDVVRVNCPADVPSLVSERLIAAQ